MLNERFLPDEVQAAFDGVTHPFGSNLNAASRITVENEGHRHNRFERVSLRATGWRDVGGAAGNPDAEIKDGLHSFRRQSRAVIADLDAALVDDNINRRRDACILCGVQCVVDQALSG